MSHAKVILFIGKGGVGKTTCAVATALNLSDGGYKVLLVSLDPAHNAGDALDIPLSKEKTTVTSALDAIEIDLEYLVKQYLKHTADTMKHLYRYLTVINLEKLLDVIRYSPGIEEYATLEALSDILAQESDRYDAIIFDTAPTGLTLRVLALPSISSLWVEKLTEMRKKILDLRSAVEHIHGERIFKIDGSEEKLPSHADADHVMKELQDYHSEIHQVQYILAEPNITSVAAVLNAEDMALFETQRAAETLKKFKIPLTLVIINKVLKLKHVPPEIELKLKRQNEMITKIHQSFPQQKIIEAVWQQEDPRGLEKLRNFCPASAEFFYNIITQSFLP